MNRGLIILAIIAIPVVIIQSNNITFEDFTFKNNAITNNIKPYSQPLPAKTAYHAEVEKTFHSSNPFIAIDPIITGSHNLLQ